MNTACWLMDSISGAHADISSTRGEHNSLGKPWEGMQVDAHAGETLASLARTMTPSASAQAALASLGGGHCLPVELCSGGHPWREGARLQGRMIVQPPWMGRRGPRGGILAARNGSSAPSSKAEAMGAGV